MKFKHIAVVAPFGRSSNDYSWRPPLPAIINQKEISANLSFTILLHHYFNIYFHQKCEIQELKQ